MKKVQIIGTLLISVLAISSCQQESASESTYPTDEGYTKVDLTHILSEDPALGVFTTNPDGYCPTVGSPKVVVLPVGFTDTSDWTENEIANIEEAYLSENLEETGYYSLKKYYEVSSYGALSFDITITDPLILDHDCLWYENQGSYYASIYLLNAAMEFLVAEGYSLSDFDSDQDGVIDGIQFVYKTTRSLSTSGIWWNYTSYLTRNSLTVPEGQTSSPSIFFFSSYTSMMNSYYGEDVPDTHTIIHESGHMLGLADYYDYSSSEAPAGGVDMMDLNVGDHSAYSKMLLGWTDPYVIDGTSEQFQITIRPFVSSGDVIILRNTDDGGFNGTPHDEYLTLSYYTPTSLNERDSGGYAEWMENPRYYGRGGTYDLAGLQVFHVDSRLIQRGQTTQYWDPKEGELGDSYVKGASNTYAQSNYVNWAGTYVSGNGPYRLIEAISSDGIDHFAGDSVTGGIYGSMGYSAILFGVGEDYSSDSFTPDDFTDCFYNNRYFNDYTRVNYDFQVLSMDEEGITILFTKNS